MYCYFSTDKHGRQFCSPITFKNGLHVAWGMIREHNSGKDPQSLPVLLLPGCQQSYGVSSKEQEL